MLESEGGSAYACIGIGIIEEVKDRAAIGIISELRDAGGLPVADIEVLDIEGESEYERESLGSEGKLIGADVR